MRSSAQWDATGVEPKLSEADLAAMRRAGRPRPMSSADYLRFLAGFPPADPAALRRRRGPRGEPFRL